MSGRPRLDSGSGGTGYGRDFNISVKETGRGEGQDCNLDRGCETSGICNEGCLPDTFPVQFREAVDVPCALVPVILREVDYFQPLRPSVSRPEFRTFSVASAEEHHVNAVQRGVLAEFHIAVPEEPGVHFPYFLPCIAGRLGEPQLHLRMVCQKSDEFARSIARAAYYSCLYHIVLQLFFKFFRFVLMIQVISPERCGTYLDEALGIVRGPAFLHLAVLAELVLHEIVR